MKNQTLQTVSQFLKFAVPINVVDCSKSIGLLTNCDPVCNKFQATKSIVPFPVSNNQKPLAFPSLKKTPPIVTMAHLGDGLNGYLDVENATLRAPRLEAVSNIGIANTSPEHAFSVGSNLYVSINSPDVLTVNGNVVCEGIKVGFIEILPSYDLAAVSNVGNVTQSTIQFANTTTAFAASF